MCEYFEVKLCSHLLCMQNPFFACKIHKNIVLLHRFENNPIFQSEYITNTSTSQLLSIYKNISHNYETEILHSIGKHQAVCHSIVFRDAKAGRFRKQSLVHTLRIVLPPTSALTYSIIPTLTTYQDDRLKRSSFFINCCTNHIYSN